MYFGCSKCKHNSQEEHIERKRKFVEAVLIKASEMGCGEQVVDNELKL